MNNDGSYWLMVIQDHVSSMVVGVQVLASITNMAMLVGGHHAVDIDHVGALNSPPGSD